MDQPKTAINIIQELIAIHTTRKDACDKLVVRIKQKETVARLASCSRHSTGCIKDLMAELSLFGDAVTGDASRDNLYHQVWNNTLEHIDTATEQAILKAFETMEDSLKILYKDFITGSGELPENMTNILSKQLAGIE